MSIKRHLMVNGTATVLQNLLLAGRNLIVVPFFLHAWGSEYYGEWLTISAIPASITIANLGLGTAAGNAFVLRYAAGDFTGAARAMRTGLALVSAAICVGVLIALGAITLAFQSGLKGLSLTHKDEVIVTFVLLVGATLVRFFGPLNEAMYRAARRSHHGTNLNSYSLLIGSGVLVLLLILGKGMVWLAGADLILASATVGWLHHCGGKLVPNVQVSSASIEKADLLSFSKKGIAYMANGLRQAIQNQGHILVTRAALGADAVTMLSTMRTLANALSQLYLSINTSIFPELQLAIAGGRDQDARRIYRLGIGVSTVAGFAGCVFLGFFGPWIYHMWTGGKFSPSPANWIILLAAAAVSSLWWAAASTFRATNHPEGPAIAGVVSAVLGVVSAIILTRFLGMNGVLIGILTTELLMAAYVLPVTSRILGQSLSTLPKDILSSRHHVVEAIKLQIAKLSASGRRSATK